MTLPLRHYQLEALSRSDGMPGFAYYMEQRTGKTPTCIKDIERGYQRGDVEAAIIVCPKCIITDWVGVKNDESGFAYWCEAPHYAVGWKQGGKPDPVLTSFGGAFLRVFVVNYDALVTTKAARDIANRMLAIYKCAVVFDESQRIKTPQARRTKTGLRMAEQAAMVRLLSGTPAAESPLNYWTQGTAIGIKDWPGSFFAFRNRYAIMRQRQFPGRKAFTEVVGYQREDELRERMAPYVYRITRKEAWPETPDKQYAKLYVELGTQQRRIYDEFKRKMLTEIDGELVTAQLAITKLLRLQQIIGGFPRTDDGRVVPVTDNKRIETLVEYLEDVEGKVIIWARFTPEVEAICKALGKDAVRYDGKTPDAEREEAKRSFRYGDAKYFVGNVKTGDVGLTLDSAQTVIYYNRDPSLEIRLQSEDRAVSISNKVLIVDMVAPNTVEVKALQALRNKRDLAATLTGDELREWI